jgi:imidazoleglycerol phosphate dehydratase HisB
VTRLPAIAGHRTRGHPRLERHDVEDVVLTGHHGARCDLELRARRRVGERIVPESEEIENADVDLEGREIHVHDVHLGLESERVPDLVRRNGLEVYRTWHDTVSVVEVEVEE